MGLPQRRKAYGLATIGKKSVYQFFLRANWLGWAFALAVMGAQLWALFVFVLGSEFDLQNENSDLVYTIKCTRDKDICVDKADLDLQGWFVFGILMAAHLLTDLIKGTKLIILSGQANEHTTRCERMRYFFGGFTLLYITSFTLYVSVIYNRAIATSNTEIIINSVIILFITQLDEYFYGILMEANETWVEEVQLQQQGERSVAEKGEDDAMIELREQNSLLQQNIVELGKNTSSLEAQNAALEEQNKLLREQSKTLLPQDEHASDEGFSRTSLCFDEGLRRSSLFSSDDVNFEELKERLEPMLYQSLKEKLSRHAGQEDTNSFSSEV